MSRIGVDFSKHKVGDVVEVQCCDDCMHRAGLAHKIPADGGAESWLCDVCGHFGIGSKINATVCNWLRLKPSPPKLVRQYEN